MDWYLVQTKSHAHNTACKHLKRQGFDVFLPLTIITKKQRRKFVNKTTPLFPGYLFIGTSTDPIPWKSINGTRGVSRVVTFDGSYRPINPHIIEGLQYRCDEYGLIKELNEVVLGDRVKIERGPFSEFICTIDEIEDGQRAWVLIDLLQQKVRTEFPLFSLSKIN